MNNKNEVNYKKLNEVISLSSKLLKIFYVVIIVITIYSATLILKEWSVFSIIGKILRVLAPLFIGMVFAWLMRPLVNYLEKKKVRRWITIVAIYVVILSILYLLLSTILPVLYEQVSELAKMLPSIFKDLKVTIDNLISKINGTIGLDFSSAKDNLFVKVEEWATTTFQELPNTLISLGSSIISGVGTFLVGLIIGAFLLFKPKREVSLIKLLPKKFQVDVELLLSEINSIFRSFVNGTLSLATLVFALCAVGFSIADLKGAILFAFFCGVTNIIPYIGPYIGAAPALIVAFTQGTGIGIAVLIVILIVQGLEGNLLQPIVMSRTMKLSPVTVIISLLIFGYFWGVMGMILSTPIVATAKSLFIFINNKFNLIKYNI